MTNKIEVTQAGIFKRVVTHDQAHASAKNFIDAHFGNRDGKGVLTGIPAMPDHDDLVLTDYIKQQQAKDAQVQALVDALRRIAKDATSPREMCEIAEDALAAWEGQQ